MAKQRQTCIGSYQGDAVDDDEICLLQIPLIEPVSSRQRQPNQRPDTDEMEPGICLISS